MPPHLDRPSSDLASPGGRARLLLVVAAALLAAVPALGSAQDEEGPGDGEWGESHREHLLLSVWGGSAYDTSGTNSTSRASSVLGGEVAWAFESIDVGVAGYGYRGLRGGDSTAVAPVLLLRLTERFETRRGLDASFAFGFGAARPRSWVAWFQLALGVRLDLGPIFLGGELAFEQYNLLRLTAGLGVKL